MLHEHFTMQSPLAPDEVLSRLAAYSADWRESKLPSDLRWGITQCRITIEGRTFRLKFWPTPSREVELQWIGQVTGSGTGSVLAVSSAYTSYTYWAFGIQFVVFFLVAWFAVGAGLWSLVLMPLLLSAGGLSTLWVGRRDRKACASVLGVAIAARPVVEEKPKIAAETP